MKKYCRICHRRFDESVTHCLRCETPLADDIETPEKIANCGFTYQCPLDWGKLDKTAVNDTRFCQSCQKNVYFARSQSEIDDLAREGKCVAFYPDVNLKIPRPSQPPPLMGVLIAPELIAEIEAEGNAKQKSENFSKQTETKSWWKFWK